MSLFHMSDTGITIFQLTHFPHLHDSIIAFATTIDPGLREFHTRPAVVSSSRRDPKPGFSESKDTRKKWTTKDFQRLPTTCLNIRTEVTMRFEKVHTLPNRNSAVFPIQMETESGPCFPRTRITLHECVMHVLDMESSFSVLVRN